MEGEGWLRSGREGACYCQEPLSQNSMVGGFKQQTFITSQFWAPGV